MFGIFLVLQPLAAAFIVDQAENLWVFWAILLLLFSLLTSVLGIGVAALKPWVLRVFPFWLPIHMAVLPFSLRLLGEPLMTGVVSSLFVGAMYLFVYRSLIDEFRDAV
jgi:hypothetical protein